MQVQSHYSALTGQLQSLRNTLESQPLDSWFRNGQEGLRGAVCPGDSLSLHLQQWSSRLCSPPRPAEGLPTLTPGSAPRAFSAQTGSAGLRLVSASGLRHTAAPGSGAGFLICDRFLGGKSFGTLPCLIFNLLQ